MKYEETHYFSVTQNHIFLVELHNFRKKKSIADLCRSVYRLTQVHIPASNHVFSFRASLSGAGKK